MRHGRLSLATLLSFALGCAHGDEVEVGEDSVRVSPEVVAESADRAEDALDSEATVRLTDPSGTLRGDADLSGDAETWRLEVEITPPEGASGWRGFVVRGDCESPTGQVVQLSPFAADEDGFESVTVFPRAWLKAGTSYAVTVRGEDGATTACGNIGEIRASTSETDRRSPPAAP